MWGWFCRQLNALWATELERGVFWRVQRYAHSRDSLHAVVTMLDRLPAPLDHFFGIAGCARRGQHWKVLHAPEHEETFIDAPQTHHLKKEIIFFILHTKTHSNINDTLFESQNHCVIVCMSISFFT